MTKSTRIKSINEVLSDGTKVSIPPEFFGNFIQASDGGWLQVINGVPCASFSKEELLVEMEVIDAEKPDKALTVESLDTSDWTELKDVLDKPDSKTINYRTLQFDIDGFHEVVSPCCFMACFSTDKQKAIDRLRIELSRVAFAPGITIKAFLARPSSIQLALGIMATSDGKVRHATFCFLHGVVEKDGKYMPMLKADLEAAGVQITCLEDQIGHDLD